MVIRLASSCPRSPVGIIKSDDPFVIGSVERQRVSEAVGSFESVGDAPDGELHPVTIRVKHQDLPIEVQEVVEAGISACHGRIRLSRCDNKVKARLDGRSNYIPKLSRTSHTSRSFRCAPS